MDTFREITPAELARRIAAGEAPRIIDVRERFEWNIARIEGAELLPLSEIGTWWQALDPSEELVIHCHHGQRSSSVCRALAAEGFIALYDLVGGIEAWRLDVDPTLRAY